MCSALLCSQPLELLVEKTIATYERPLGASEALRRVFECVASGILLKGELHKHRYFQPVVN